MANDEYLTPIPYINIIKRVMPEIDLDPFSSIIANERIKAKTFYTKEQNGFTKHWHGNIYANPPYSRGNLPAFSETTLEAINRCKTSAIEQFIGLVPNSTSENWFQKLLKQSGMLICLPDHRLKFTTLENGKFVENSSPDFGNTFFYWGHSRYKFARVFSTIGTIVSQL